MSTTRVNNNAKLTTARSVLETCERDICVKQIVSSKITRSHTRTHPRVWRRKSAGRYCTHANQLITRHSKFVASCRRFSDLYYVVHVRKQLPSKLFEMCNAKKVACIRSVCTESGCTLTRQVAKQILGRPVGESEYNALHRPFDASFSSQRFYIAIQVNGTSTDAAIDSCSDVNLVSENVLETLCPDWRNLPDAGQIVLRSHTEHLIPQASTKWLAINFQNSHVKNMLLKFVVTKDEDELLLGAEFLKQSHLGLSIAGEKDNRKYQLVFPAECSDRCRTEHVPVYDGPINSVARNSQNVLLKPYESEYVCFHVSQVSSDSKAVITNASNHAENHGRAQGCMIFPSVSDVTLQNGKWVAQALVVNTTSSPVRIKCNDLRGNVERIHAADFSFLPATSTVTANIEQNLAESLGAPLGAPVAMCRQIVSNSPIHDPIPPGLYGSDDVADFADLDAVPEDATFGTEVMSQSPVDAIPWNNIPPEFHPAVRELFVEKYPTVLSRHQYDMGNISKTLGQIYIPLVDKVPKSRKVYFSSEKDMRMLNDILVSMLKYKIIKRSQSAWGAPVFLLRRKSGQQPLRLLCAICDLNEVLAKPVPILPNIDKLLQNLTSSGIGLMSSLDLTNGFHSVEIYPPHQTRLSFLTPFGSFKFSRGVMGLSTLPAFYAAKIFELVNTDPHTGMYDPIPGVWPFMDDIPVVSPGHSVESVEFDLHYQKLDKLLSRIAFHNAKISPEKLVLFQRKAVILGHLIEDGRIKIDPKRLDKMRAAPMPTNLKGAQKWSGFLASLKPFAPLELGRCHAILSSLTSAKRSFEILPEHVQAFDLAKQILTKHEFFLDIPDAQKVKVLYTDASQLCLGAILLEVEQPLEIVKNSQEITHVEFDARDVIGKSVKQLNLKVWPSRKVPADGDCFYHALADQFRILGMDNFPSDHYELRLCIANFAMNHSRKPEWLVKIKPKFNDWDSFMESVIPRKAHVDSYGIMLQCAADFMRRHILLVLPNGVVNLIFGGEEGDSKPPVWLGFVPPGETQLGHFQSLVNYEPNQFTWYASTDLVKNDVHSMSQQEIFELVKSQMFGKTDGRMKVKVIAYYSKVVAEVDRHKAIYEKELMALIGALNTFEDYLSNSPCVITLIDSRTAYFLAAKGVHKSAVKCRRWNVLLQTRFPNLMLHLIGTDDNWSDVMSRLYDVPEQIERQFKIRCLEIPPIPAMDGQMWSFDELESFVELNPDLLRESDTPAPP